MIHTFVRAIPWPLAVALAVLVAAPGCSDPVTVSAGDDLDGQQDEDPPADTVPFVTRYSVWGTHASEFHEETRMVIRDEETWADAFAKIRQDRDPPRIDFENRTLLLAAYGEYVPTSPHYGPGGVRVDSLRVVQGMGTGFLTNVTCSGLYGMAQVTHPVHVVQVPRVDAEVEWVESSVVRFCNPAPWNPPLNP